jgi:hypothetical protein
MRLFVGVVFPRPGVVGTSGFRVYPRDVGPNWSIDINPGFAVVGTAVTGIERYLCYIPTRRNIALTGFNTAPTATRTHRVFLAVYDKAVLGSEYTSRVVVTEDTGSGAPVPTDNPAFYMELATFTIGPGQSNVNTANITNTAPHAAYGYNLANISLGTGVVSAYPDLAIGPPTYAMQGSQVRFAGGVKPATGTWTNGATVNLGSIPVQYAPRYQRYLPLTGTNGAHCRLTVAPTGALTLLIDPNVVVPVTFVALDGAAFELE